MPIPSPLILIIQAHPYPSHSRAGRALVHAVQDLANIRLRSLYDLYPDFDIDVAAEQAAVAQADLLVWLHPIYWYTTPGLLKHWFDKVLVQGWAYGKDGNALHGKHCLWVPTTGGDEQAYTPAGRHQHPFDHFTGPVEQTARYCGMVWEPPFPVHGAHVLSEAGLQHAAQAFRARLAGWRSTDPEGPSHAG